MYLLTFSLTSVNVLINVGERRFHLNNVNIYVKNHGSVNTMGKDLGYEGEKLQYFVKQQQDYERGERIAEREIERDRIAAQEKERAKIAANERLEMARIEGIAEQAERDRELKRTELETDKESKLSSEIELEKLKHSFEMKHLELMGQLEVHRASFKTELEKQKSEKLAHARDPKLPYFEKVKIRWIVICQDLRNTRQQINGIKMCGPSS